MQENDDEAAKISQNATKFVQENLTIEKIDHYLALILQEYSNLQQFDLHRPSLPALTIHYLEE